MITERLALTELGRGQAVVFLHGFPLSSVCWDQVKDEISYRNRVITPDLRGFGNSPTPDDIYGMDAMAQDIVAMLDDLDIVKCALIGHSMGGYVALAFAKAFPERLTALGLICTQATADTEQTKATRIKQAQLILEEGASAIADIMIPKLFAPAIYRDDEDDLRGRVRLIIERNKIRGLAGALHGMAERPDNTDILHTLTMPALVMAAEQDALIAPEKSVAMAELLPNAQLVTLHDSGHLPMLEQPGATAAAIRNFIQELKLDEDY